MIDINYYIKEILKYEDSVILQGFGAFIATYKTAEIKSKTGSIAPPTKHISFDDKQKEDNGRLVAYIRQKENLEEHEIRKYIDDYVIEVQRKLNSGEQVRINELGYLLKDKAYKIQFIQDTVENILLDSYGMEEIEWDISKKDKVVTNGFKTEKNKSKSKLFIIPISILVVAILVLSILISDRIKKSDSDSGTFLSNLFSRQYKKKDIITVTDDSKITKNIDSLAQKQNALYFEENKYAGYKKFYLIAGSFSIYNNAELFKKELDAQGYNAEILEVDGKIFRVSMKVFSNRNEALQELNRLKGLHGDQSLWILNSM